VPDRSVGVVDKAWLGGFVRVRVCVGLRTRETDASYAADNWAVPPPKPLSVKHILRCNLYQCRDLPAADSDGRADPYVRFYCGGAEESTPRLAKENNLNPMWY
jgi:hypothetical protein